MSGEYLVRLTVKNNLILRAITEHGFSSVADFCRDSSLPCNSVQNLVAMRLAPIGQDGSFRQVAKDLMEVLGAAPSDLWTDTQLTLKLKKSGSEMVVDEGAIEHILENHTRAMTLPDPADDVSFKEDAELVRLMVDTLSAREAKVLRLRFGIESGEERTLDEVAKIIGVTRERIRQLEQSGLRKLRMPTRATFFREAGLKEVTVNDLSDVIRCIDFDDIRPANKPLHEAAKNVLRRHGHLLQNREADKPSKPA